MISFHPMKMKVLHVIPSVSPVHGGPSRAISLMEEALGLQGVVVETATTDDNGPGHRYGYGIAERLESPTGTTRWFFPKQTEFYKFSRPLSSWLAKNIRHFDLVHVHALFSHASVAAARAAKNSGVPYIVRPLGVLNRYGMKHRRSSLKCISLQFIEKHILKGAAAVHFTDEAERQEAEALGVPFKSEVVPLGTSNPCEGDRTRFLEKHPEFLGKTTILYLSRIDPKKGLELLLDSIAILRKRGVDGFHVAIAGDGEADYTAGLKKRSLELGLDDRLIWLGQIDGEDKADAFANSDIFVLPSHSENFGIALAEALSYGLACVTTRGVAISRAIEKTSSGMVVDSKAPAIARALEELLADETLRSQLGANAKSLALREYSLEAMGGRLKSMYEAFARLEHERE